MPAISPWRGYGVHGDMMNAAICDERYRLANKPDHMVLTSRMPGTMILSLVFALVLNCNVGNDTNKKDDLGGGRKSYSGTNATVDTGAAPGADISADSDTDADTGTCAEGCSAPTPICGPDSKCTNTRWVEPISTLPDKWRSTINTSVWTKWVRSIIPVVGQASTQDAALMEVAYYAEKIHMPQGQVLVTDLVDSMLGARPTRFSVYPACPKAFMHPSVKPTMSSGGGGWTETLVSEDWILRYPKCTGEYAVPCDQIPAGTLCNNCQWQNPSEPETCRDTLAHEHGHTADLHRRNYLDASVDALARQVFPSNNIEGPAWSASKYFMNPSLETSTGRDRGRYVMSSQELHYWSAAQKFTMSSYPPGWGYVLKTTRCPEVGLTEACPDTLTRTYAVPLDADGVIR